MANPIPTAGDLVAEVNFLSAQLITGKLSPETTLAVIDRDSGEVSVVKGLTIEDHYNDPEDDEAERTLIGQTLWIEVEAQ